ncbi:hypothetical protein [Actinomadura fibrosa]|uniref:Uncharacterized protein n=1 Tax=Actinomadura fibrosa TaxID=111802 RepID=A0ABW2XG39_9ACTN|nr:hypothetical protein [Actinomadura fibrosa]
MDIRLAARTGGAQTVRMALGAGQEVGYGLQGAAAVPERAHERGVTYPGTWQDTDLTCDLGSGGVKETLVLRSAKAPTTFTFPLALKGLSVKVADGHVVFTDAAGHTKAMVPAGFMNDSAVRPTTSTRVAYSLVTADGVPALRVDLDRGWLADPARAFPIKVDPSVEINTAGTSMTVTGSGQVGGGQDLAIGSHSAAYLGFPNLDDRLKNHKIFGASLWMVDYYSATCRFRLASVRPVTQAWQGQFGFSYPGPSVGSVIARTSFSYGHIELGATKSQCPTKAVTYNLGKGGRDLIQRPAGHPSSISPGPKVIISPDGSPHTTNPANGPPGPFRVEREFAIGHRRADPRLDKAVRSGCRCPGGRRLGRSQQRRA